MLANAEQIISQIASTGAADQAGRAIRAAHEAAHSPALQKAQAAAAAYNPGRRNMERYAADIEALTTHRICVRSEALRRLIDDAIKVKEEVEGLGATHNKAQVFESCLREAGGSPAEIEAANRAETEADEAWQAGWDRLKAAAEAVAEAPFADVEDALARADAYARLVGTREDNTPDCDEDVIAMGDAYRAALIDMAERLPGYEEFGDAISAYRAVERRLTDANREYDGQFGNQLTPKREDNPALFDLLNRLSDERETAQNAILAGTPGDLDQLLVQMEVAFDQGNGLDIETYAVRERVRTKTGTATEPLTVEDLRGDDGERRGLVLIASSTARLRDKAMASDWRELFGSIAGIHPNASDALRRAYDAGMDSAGLINIQLVGQPDENLPLLTFRDSKGAQYWVSPTASWRGEPVR